MMGSKNGEHNDSLDNAFNELQKLLGALNSPTGLDLDSPAGSPAQGLKITTPEAWRDDLACIFSTSPKRKWNPLTSSHKGSLPRIGEAVLDLQARPRMFGREPREPLPQLSPVGAVSSTAQLVPFSASCERSFMALAADEFSPTVPDSSRSQRKGDTLDELARMAKLLEQRDQELNRADIQLSLRDKNVEDLKASVNELSKSLAAVRGELAQREKELHEARTQLAVKAPHLEKPPRLCADALSATKEELHKITFALQRLETNQAKHQQDSSDFLKAIASSSSTPVLDQLYEMGEADVIGMGNYGFVVTCVSKKSGERVVIKLQGEKRAGIAASEWAHGSGIGKHPSIVNHVQVLLHNDFNRTVTRLLEDAFVSGTLSGKRPVFFPQQYFCCVLEHMDAGTAQHLLDSGSLTLEGVAAIARQTSEALTYIHQGKRTHNDVKPDNILLRKSPDGDHLLAKLADFGLADHSTNRSRDMEMFGYTVWCLGTGAKFKNCPAKGERQTACDAFRTILQGKETESKTGDALARVVEGVWQERLTMQEVANMKSIASCKIRLMLSKNAK